MTDRKKTVVLYSSSLLVLIMVTLVWLSGISSGLLQQISKTLAEDFQQEIESVMRRIKGLDSGPMIQDGFLDNLNKHI